MIPAIDLHPIGVPIAMPVVADHTCAITGIGASGDALQLWIPQLAESSVFGSDENHGFARFPRSQTDVPFNARLAIVSSTFSSIVNLADLKLAFPVIQTLPKGKVLLASSRCHRWQDGSFELNAKIYGRDGDLCTEFCLGDGLEHVQTDLQGRIWAGYTDEGIYGNYGWGFDPIGVLGLVCFDGHGNKIWEYTGPANYPPISDCYALNCTEEAVWICYYTDFPIMRIDPEFQIRAWRSDLSGPRQLAVSENTVLAFGGYQEEANDCWLLRLSAETAERVGKVNLRLPDGVDIRNAKIVGRGRFLHVFANQLWFRFEVPA
jgi:hypothetical protein